MSVKACCRWRASNLGLLSLSFPALPPALPLTVSLPLPYPLPLPSLTLPVQLPPPPASTTRHRNPDFPYLNCPFPPPASRLPPQTAHTAHSMATTSSIPGAENVRSEKQTSIARVSPPFSPLLEQPERTIEAGHERADADCSPSLVPILRFHFDTLTSSSSFASPRCTALFFVLSSPFNRPTTTPS